MVKDSKRLEKQERRKHDRQTQAQREGSARFFKRIAGVTGAGILLLLLVVGWNRGWIGGNAEEHPYAGFAQCLTDAGLTMYGTDWCPHCQEQKKMFDDSFDFIDYVNCDFNQSVCKQKGVTGYPTWHFDGAFWAEGVQTFPQFAEVSGCELPE